MEQLYTLRREGKRLIFEEWHGEPELRERQAGPRCDKSAVLDCLKAVHPSGLALRELCFELRAQMGRTTIFRLLKDMQSAGEVEVAHVQRGHNGRPYYVYRILSK